MNSKRVLVPILSLMFLISGISLIANSATYISDSQKEIIRDSKRLNDLTIFRKAIEDYKTRNGYYPKLETGTNIKGYVNSAWTEQWTSFCNLIGLSSCPVDPINTIISCDCSIFGVCTENNINSNIDNISCYNSKSQTFACTDGSNIYQYQSLNNGRNYSLSMDFEYSDNVNWEVASSSSDNIISIKGSCISGNNPYKIFSNKAQKCGDGILNYGEVCEVGSKKTEFCKTSDNKTGIRYINCSSSCLWDSSNVGECLNIGFCGDSIIQKDKGEECDGGYQKMCYNYQDYLYKNPSDLAAVNSHHNWYNEQLRYCGLNCKWNSNYIDSTAYCGGYCGDGVVQGDKGEECDNSNSKHCNASTCKFQNSKPTIDFDFYKDRFSENSYIKSDVWSGDKLQYQNNYYDPNTVNLIPADKQDKTYVAIWNSDFIEIKIDAADKESDSLSYKYNFPVSYNYNFILKYAKSSDASRTFYNYNLGDYVKGADIIRMYPTKIKNGKNTYKYWIENEDNLLFGSNYEGYYSLEVTVQEDYKEGQNSSTNPHDSTTSKTIDFKIGPGCGDKILQKELGETCEWKPGVIIDSIMVDWGVYVDPVTSRRFRQPDGNGDCVAQIFTNKIGNLTFNFPGKVDDVSCTDKYYGICEKRTHLGCETGWIKGEYDNCYRLTSKTETWKEAQDECASYNASLISYTDTKESDFIKNQSVFNSQTVWIGVHKVGNYWEEDATKIKMAVVKPRIGAGIFSTSIYDAGIGSSVSNANYCGLPLEFEACQDNRGYCGDGLKNPQFKSCDPKSDEYSYFNTDVAVFSNTAADTNYYTQYFCATVEGKYGKTKPCTSFNGYCGDGLIQYNLNNAAEQQGGNNEKNTIVVDKIHPEQCDPLGHIVNASASSKDNTYTCGSADSSLACLDLDYSKKNLDDIYGGYCGDGFVQYNLTDIGVKNDIANISTLKNTVGGTPEQCDPLNHSVTAINSSKNNTYTCGSADSSLACLDLDYSKKNLNNLYGGYCGDGLIQYNLNNTAEEQDGNNEKNAIVVDETHPEQCDPSNHSVLASDSSKNNTYTCGSADSADACLDLDYSKKDSKNNYGGYCGDGFVQYNLTDVGIKNDPSNISTFKATAGGTPEQCDPLNHSVTPDISNINYQYACGAANTANACTDINGYCGDKILQSNYGEKCEVKTNGKYDLYDGSQTFTDRTNLTCNSNCGYDSDGWTCADGYYWNKVNYSPNTRNIQLNACVPVPDNSTIKGTLHGGDDYMCNERYEKDGLGGCVACDPGYYSYAGGVCTPCTEISNSNWVTNGSKPDNCEFNCKASFKYDINNRKCNPCEQGKWTAEANRDAFCGSCTIIPNMTSWLTNGTSATTCDFSCKARFSYNKPSVSCDTCAYGTWTSEGNQSPTCSPCIAIPNSNWTSNGSVLNNCEFNCKASFSYDSANRKCNPCDAGKWTAEANRSASCDPCTAIPNMTSWLTNGTSATTCDFNCNERYSYNKTSRTCNICDFGFWASAGNQMTPCGNCNNKPSNSHYTSNGSVSNNCNWDCDTDYNKVGNSCVLRTCVYPNDYEQTSSDCISNGYADTYYQKKASSNCTVPSGGDSVTAYAPANGSYTDTVWCYGDRTGTYDCARIGDIQPNACWYCNFSGTGTVGDSSACSNRGTRYYTYTCNQSIHTVNWWSGWGSCSCNTEYYGSACESTCSYGNWGETSRDCQSNNQWYAWYSRSVTGSNCGGASSTSAWVGASCTYCSSNSGCSYTTSLSCAYYTSLGVYISGRPTCRGGYSVASYNSSSSCGTYATWTSANCVGTNVCNTGNHTYNGCP